MSVAALDHPYICNVHEVGEIEGRDFIVMEYVDGRTLKDRLAEEPLPLKEALQLASEIAEALEHAHSKGIMHRDPKAANIMLTRNGHAKVMDFGLAKQLRQVEVAASNEATLTALTKEGTMPGTLAYMSPEQLRAKPADARSDIFSFGIVLFEMLTGIHPFKKESKMETASAILGDPSPPLADSMPAKLLASNFAARQHFPYEDNSGAEHSLRSTERPDRNRDPRVDHIRKHSRGSPVSRLYSVPIAAGPLGCL